MGGSFVTPIRLTNMTIDNNMILIDIRYINLYLSNLFKFKNMVFQKEIILPPFPRGFHLITNYIKKELPQMTGIVNVFIKYTSASLTINENADLPSGLT